MNPVREFISQNDAVEKTGISDYRMRKSRNENKPIDGYYFYFKNPKPEQYVKEFCAYCGKEFMCQNSRLNNKSGNLFCSRKCADEFKRKRRDLNCTCYICGKKFHRRLSETHDEVNLCTKQCFSIWQSKRMSGNGNHQFNLKGYKNSSWKSDEKISVYGYKLIRVLDHPLRNCDDFVLEHRLIAEKFLLNEKNFIEIDGKIYLSPEYVVHHIDFNRLNNSIDNLIVLPKQIHSKFHMSLKTIIRNSNNGRIITSKNIQFSKYELKEKLYTYLKEIGYELEDTERGKGGFGSTGIK